MTILIDNRSGLPIYEQIVSQLREQILSGALRPGGGGLRPFYRRPGAAAARPGALPPGNSEE